MIADSQTATASAAGICLIKVEATDLYSTQTRTFELMVQNPVQDFTITVNPTFRINDDQS